MKRTLMAVAVTMFTLAAMAQNGVIKSPLKVSDTPHPFWIGGALGLTIKDYKDNGTSYNQGGSSETTLTIAPELGYTINENWDVAVSLGLSMNKNINGVSGNDVTSFLVAPYARYTYLKTGSISLFFDGLVGFGSAKPKGGDATTVFNIGLRPGLKLQATDRLSLVATYGMFGYTSVKDMYNEFSFGIDQTAITFGIYHSF